MPSRSRHELIQCLQKPGMQGTSAVFTVGRRKEACSQLRDTIENGVCRTGKHWRETKSGVALLPPGLTLSIWTLTLNAISIVSKPLCQLTLLIMVITILSQDLCGTGLPEIHALLSWPPRSWYYHTGLPSCPSRLPLTEALIKRSQTP